MNLIVYGEDVATADLKALHRIVGGRDIERVGENAFRITHAHAADRAEVAEHCAKAKLDWGFVAEGASLGDFGLLAMDMDSTLIGIECIDEIADFAGRKAEVAAVTAAAMRGEIDWPESLRQRVKALAGLDVAALGRVYDERLRFNPGAEALIAAARRRGITTLLVSGGFTYFTDRVRERLGFDHAYSNTLVVEDGKLAGTVTGALVDAQGKAGHVRRLKEELGLARERVLAIGDGANDLPMMVQAGTSIAYHAKPVVRESATYAIDYGDLSGVLNLFPESGSSSFSGRGSGK
ncbi:MAG TPA: phosphoserine phosphatase SerB [Usitatibacter sp.]|jgi:phosphoserine phosphatase|nr:phosphoserine phosphatase SerB [Usitatibacter sp.]